MSSDRSIGEEIENPSKKFIRGQVKGLSESDQGDSNTSVEFFSRKNVGYVKTTKSLGPINNLSVETRRRIKQGNDILHKRRVEERNRRIEEQAKLRKDGPDVD